MRNRGKGNSNMDEEVAGLPGVSESGPGTGEQFETDAVTLDGSEAATIVGATVTVNQGNIGKVRATEVTVNDGGIGTAQASVIQVTDGGIGMAQGDSITVSDGGVGVLVAQNAELHNASVLLVAARQVGGDARILFDVRAGAALGLALGLVIVGFWILAGRRRA